MNSHVPLLSLDPSADDVSYAPVLHGVKFGSKAAAEQCAAALDEARQPAPDDFLQRWPASKRVNSSRAPDDDPTLIEEITSHSN
jgi:hypothetical protein